MTGKRLKPSNYDKNGDIIPSGWEDNKMTNKEAIKELKAYKEYYPDEPFDKAIKAIEVVDKIKKTGINLNKLSGNDFCSDFGSATYDIMCEAYGSDTDCESWIKEKEE